MTPERRKEIEEWKYGFPVSNLYVGAPFLYAFDLVADLLAYVKELEGHLPIKGEPIDVDEGLENQLPPCCEKVRSFTAKIHVDKMVEIMEDQERLRNEVFGLGRLLEESKNTRDVFHDGVVKAVEERDEARAKVKELEGTQDELKRYIEYLKDGRELFQKAIDKRAGELIDDARAKAFEEAEWAIMGVEAEWGTVLYGFILGKCLEAIRKAAGK